ncbi:MAG TPA: type II toxin-antitoxin system HicB family antitoxin [Candidatus Thermoplasmatota archaeon]|nr:type II toxin-antitoxin system HicB family antitoxin [Candidatus Thermoplasmatota archaeon]
MTQGSTLDEVRENIIDAIKLNIEHLRATGQPIPTLPAEVHGQDLLLPLVTHDILHRGKRPKRGFTPGSGNSTPAESFDYILA